MANIIEIKRPYCIQLTVILEDTNPFTVNILSNALVGWAKTNLGDYPCEWNVAKARMDKDLLEAIDYDVVGESNPFVEGEEENSSDL